MMKLIIEDDEGRKTVVPLVRDEITIGRQDGNTIRLTERNVSRRHARLLKENGNVLIEDLGSYNGVRVNGEKITGRTRIKEGDLVEIGDYDLGIQGKLDAPVVTPAAVTTRPPTIPPGGLKPPRPPTLPPQAMPGALGAAQAAFVSTKTAPAVQAPTPPPAVTSLKPGDVLELGHLKFRFCAPGEKFSPPPEKGEDGAQKGGLKPTTAELIAGVQGRMPSSAARKAGSRGRLAVILAALVAVGAAAFFLTRSRKPASPEEATGEDAVKAGDALFKQRKYVAAMELYEKAGSSPTPNRRKAAEEARGEEAYNALRAAIAAGDGDKARNLFERCSAESTYWCQQTQEQADQVKAVYANKHLANANSLKSAGKLDACAAEASNVLAFDSGNAQALALQSQCRPQEAAKTESAREEGPSPKEREVKASRLAQASSNKLGARHFGGAVKDAQAALAQSPKDKNTLMLSYRSLGYGYAYLNDKGNAVKWQ